MLQLRSASQNYEWGRLAADSEVAQLAQANGQEIDGAKPYAELWMGTHPKTPSRLSDGRPLQELLEQHPTQLLGEQVARVYGPQLPFLFKVLSVAKALSIQAHPDKALAEQLHARAPQIYPDANHKPEMALALGQGMEALCGFVPLHELQHHLRVVPELAECVGAAESAALLALSEPDKQVLRDAFSGLMKAEPSCLKDAVQRLCARLSAPQPPEGHPAHDDRDQQSPPNTSTSAPASATSNGAHAASGNGHAAESDAGCAASASSSAAQPAASRSLSPPPQQHAKRVRQDDGDAERRGVTTGAQALHGGLSAARMELLLRLQGQFPCDVGILASLFLNLVHLPGGSALALSANEPHAYLAGELVECMANSDNVMRAGLTPKALDVPSLTAALTYHQGRAEVMQGSAVSSVPGLRLYRPPFQEFEVQCLQLPAGGSAALPASQGPQLMLVQHGAAAATALRSSSSSSDEGAWPAIGAQVKELSGEVQVARGSLVFIAAGVPLQVTACAERGLEAWIAAVNNVFFQLQELAPCAGIQGAGSRSI